MKAHRVRESLPAMEPAGLYIHVPFCRRKCAYCDFYSIESTGSAARWLSALTLEASRCGSVFPSFDTVYLGGGTPSLLAGDLLQALMDRVVFRFPVLENAEITIEANPCDIDPGKIRLLQSLGFTRISLGVQSFDGGVLDFLGRSHTGEQAEGALAALKSRWRGSTALDLIYGVPGQSESLWLRTMEKALAFAPDHVSCYQLSVEKGTRLYRLEAAGRFHRPGESLLSALFIGTSRFMTARGYTHYEVSNFASGDSGRSRHNVKYWRHSPYLGLGPSAHSFDGLRRWWNVRSVRRYCESLESNGAAVEGGETLGEFELRREAVLLGLRTSEGIRAELVPDTPETRLFLDGCDRMGFLNLQGGRIVPTTKGLLVADHLAVSLC